MRSDDPLFWMEQARCRGLDPNLFVPSFNPDTRQGPNKNALAVCNGDVDEPKPCPVRKECLVYGMDQGATGCFGGKALYNGKIRRNRK